MYEIVLGYFPMHRCYLMSLLVSNKENLYLQCYLFYFPIICVKKYEKVKALKILNEISIVILMNANDTIIFVNSETVTKMVC